MLTALPGWVVDNDTSVRDEVAGWRDLSPSERWQLALACSRDAMWAAGLSGMKERILAQIDPLPASSEAALERLRRAAGWGDGRR